LNAATSKGVDAVGMFGAPTGLGDAGGFALRLGLAATGRLNTATGDRLSRDR